MLSPTHEILLHALGSGFDQNCAESFNSGYTHSIVKSSSFELKVEQLVQYSRSIGCKTFHTESR